MIGHRIKQLREGKNVKRLYLAEILEIDESTLGKIENNQVKISAERLVQVANALDVGINEFFSGIPSKNFNPEFEIYSEIKSLREQQERQSQLLEVQKNLISDLLAKTNSLLVHLGNSSGNVH